MPDIVARRWIFLTHTMAYSSLQDFILAVEQMILCTGIKLGMFIQKVAYNLIRMEETREINPVLKATSDF